MGDNYTQGGGQAGGSNSGQWINPPAPIYYWTILQLTTFIQLAVKATQETVSSSLLVVLRSYVYCYEHAVRVSRDYRKMS